MLHVPKKDIKIEIPIGSGFRIDNVGYRTVMQDQFLALHKRNNNQIRCCDGCYFQKARADGERRFQYFGNLIDYVPLPCRHFLCHEDERSDARCVIFVKDETVGYPKIPSKPHSKLDIKDLTFDWNREYPTTISFVGDLHLGFDGTISSPKYEVESYQIEPEIQIEYRWEL